MTAEEIVKIIKACKQSSVTKIKFGELELEFDNLTKEANSSNNNTNIGLKETSGYPEMEAVPEIEELENKLSEARHEEVMDEFAMANLMADNPVAFENQLRGRLNEEQ